MSATALPAEPARIAIVADPVTIASTAEPVLVALAAESVPIAIAVALQLPVDPGTISAFDVVRSLVVGFGVFSIATYSVVTVSYALVHVAGLAELREQQRRKEWTPAYEPFGSPFLPSVGMLVPAYDEAETIVESVRALLTIEYPDVEVVVVNDGSTDETLERLREAFDLATVDAEFPLDVPCERIRAVYRSQTHDRLLVVDKDNGGKADALNAGVWATDQELFCAIDADTVVDRQSLLSVVRPFLEAPESVVATGGTIRVANGCDVVDGEVVDSEFPPGVLAGLQVAEYLRSFYSGRLGLDRLRSLVLISGAFGVFRTDLVRDIGGYRAESVTEDFDLVVRLHRHLVDAERDYRVRYVPEPVAWTEVPRTHGQLLRQRRRWFLGMIETLAANWRMVGNPRYGLVGLFALPLFVVAETVGPLIEGIGYALLVPAVLLDVISGRFFLLFVLVTTGAGVLFSWFSVFSEVASFRRYDTVPEVLRLLGFGALEHLGYRQWKALTAWRGLLGFLRGEHDWGEMERTGFSAGEPVVASPVDEGAQGGSHVGVAEDGDAAGGDAPAGDGTTPTPSDLRRSDRDG